jgi:hypothetical protein
LLLDGFVREMRESSAQLSAEMLLRCLNCRGREECRHVDFDFAPPTESDMRREEFELPERGSKIRQKVGKKSETGFCRWTKFSELHPFRKILRSR